MARTPFDDLVHRVNNLLATIEIQGEVARSDGTLAAHAQALAVIADSARRTQEEVRTLRRAHAAHDSGAGGAGGAGGTGGASGAAGGSSGSIAESL